MKSFRLLIIIVLIVALLLSIVIVFFANNNNVVSSDKTGNLPIEATYSLNTIKSISDYETLTNCINTLLKQVYDNNNEGINSLLINENKEKNQLPKVDYNYDYVIKKVYDYDSKLYVRTYFVFGDILNKQEKNKTEYNFVINIDSVNKTFEIAQLEVAYSKYVDYSDKNNLKIDKSLAEIVTNIKQNDYNSAKIVEGLGTKDIIAYYFKQFILSMIYDSQKAYELLDNEYKQNRFEDFSKFQEYINSNIDDLENSFILKYKVKEFDDYKEYLCIDNYNNYYIFKEKIPMEYTVLLDQYTINDEIFISDYNKKKGASRAQMNLNLFAQMVNRQDYSAAYNVLNKDFRDKYYKTEEEFEQYIKNNLFKHNEFVFEEIEGEESSFKIKTNIKNIEDSNQSKIKRFKINIDKSNFSISYDV